MGGRGGPFGTSTPLYTGSTGDYTGGTTTLLSGYNYGGEWIMLQLPSAIVPSTFVFYDNGLTHGNGKTSYAIVANSTNGSTWTLLGQGGFTTYQACTVNLMAMSLTYFRVVINSSTQTYGNWQQFGLNVSVAATNNVIADNGTLTKTAGSFDIEHATPAKAALGLWLRHCFVESPTRGDNLYTFNVTADADGAAVVVPLDAYWRDLNENPRCWVSRVDGFGHGYGSVDEALSALTVHCERAGSYNVLLIGTQKDAAAVAFFDGGGGVEYAPPREPQFYRRGSSRLKRRWAGPPKSYFVVVCSAKDE